MQGLMLHCGAQQATLAQVKAVPVPAKTKTYNPLPYGQTIEFLKAQATMHLGLELESEGYGLNANGDQMFGVLRFSAGAADHGLAMGLRGSYNKTLANAVAAGAGVFVCDNLCFSGDAFKIIRKNTPNVWRDFRSMIMAHVQNALGHYRDMSRDIDRMKATPCHEQRGYSILGVAVGEQLLTPTQATVAFGDWRKPRHEEFSERNMWSLYNCVTEGLKKGQPAKTIDRHTSAHGFFMERLAA